MAWYTIPIAVCNACQHYTDVLTQPGMVLSMNQSGNSYDNATCESFLKTLKHEYGDKRDVRVPRRRSSTPGLHLCLRRTAARPQKQVLSCLPRPGRENLVDWKFVLRSVLLLVQDDFSGLLPIIQSLFPNTDIQLCAVHMQRNAKTHLSKPDAGEFQHRCRVIKSSWNLEVANQQFEQLCDRFAQDYSTFIAEL